MTPSVVLTGGVRKNALTREQVIEKIIRWNALYGEPPSTADWNPSLARWRAQEWRIERYRLGDPETGERWPALNSAKRLFGGSFDAAVREAGLRPHRPGPRRRAAGAARPDVQQRAPQAPRQVEAELAAAAARVAEAERRAERAEQRAVAAERTAAQLAARANGNGSGRRNGNGHGPVGPGPLANAIRALAAARATNNNQRLSEALNDVASAAVRWRERL